MTSRAAGSQRRDFLLRLLRPLTRFTSRVGTWRRCRTSTGLVGVCRWSSGQRVCPRPQNVRRSSPRALDPGDGGRPGPARREMVAAAFEQVELDPGLGSIFGNSRRAAAAGGDRPRSRGRGRPHVVADEPVGALDVSVRARIRRPSRQLTERRLTLALISTDLEIARPISTAASSSYAWERVVERPHRGDRGGAASSLYRDAPSVDPRSGNPDLVAVRLLPVVAERAQDPVDRPTGCAYHPRCPRAVCGFVPGVERPALVRVGETVSSRAIGPVIPGRGRGHRGKPRLS